MPGSKPVSVTNRLRSCLVVLRDVYDASYDLDTFRLVAPFSIDKLLIHLKVIRQICLTCFDPINRINVRFNHPVIEMDGRKFLSYHQCLYSMLEKTYVRLTMPLLIAGFDDLDSTERAKILSESASQILNNLKPLPALNWELLNVELRKEAILIESNGEIPPKSKSDKGGLAPNSNERLKLLIEKGKALVVKKKYRSKAALAKELGGCDIRGRAFKTIWVEHEKKYGCRDSPPKVVPLLDDSGSYEDDQEALDRLIDEQKRDDQSDNLFRNGRRSANRRRP